MREEKVAVENPWAANWHHSSSLPSGTIPMSDDSIWTSVNALTQMISLKVTVAMVTLHSLLSSVQVLPQGTHA